jgi:outer membrane protein TolC
MHDRFFLLTLGAALGLSALAAQPVSAQPRPTPAPTASALPSPVQAVLPAVPTVAPGYSAPTGGPLPSGDLVGIAQEPFVGIKLEDAITMALQRNTDLAISQSNVRIANYQIVAAQGAYDVKFQLAPQYQSSVTPSVSALETGPNGGPITQDSAGATAAFTGLTGSGGTYSVGASATRVLNNSVVNSYNPFYDTAVSLAFSQPLLRNAGYNDARRQLDVARANAKAQSDALLMQAAQTITNVSDTYWDLVEAWRNVGIQEEGLRQAQAQASSNTRLASRGAVAPVDIVESNSQVEVFQDNVFAALQDVQRLQTQLKGLVLSNPGDPVWLANLVPTSAVGELPPEPKVEDLIVTALRNRPEVDELRADHLIAAAQLAYAKNQLRPQLDLGLGYTANGFSGLPTNPASDPFLTIFSQEGGTINQLINLANAGLAPANQIPLLVTNFGTLPANQNGKFGASWSGVLQNRYPTYSIGLSLQLPLRNTTAKADYKIADEQAKQIAVQELALVQRIRMDAVNAIQTLRETQYRLVAASSARAASERVLLAEQRKFAVGNSTTFLVLQRQLDVANNRGRELQAQTSLNKAVVELNRVAGTAFKDNNIDIAGFGAVTLEKQTSTTQYLPAGQSSK